MQCVLIAQRAGAFSRSLAEALSEHFEVHICARGDTALKLLGSLRPDILILDLMLPCLDGLTVLKAATYIPPRVLALTPMLDAGVLQAACDAGISELLALPCTVDAVLARLKMRSPSPGR